MSVLITTTRVTGAFTHGIDEQMIPLETTPLYSTNSYPNRYWTAQRNTTEWSVFMAELTTSGNAIAKLLLQNLAPTLHGAHIGEHHQTPSSVWLTS